MKLTIRKAKHGEAGPVLDILHQAFREYVGVLDPPSGVFRETFKTIEAAIAAQGILLCLANDNPIGCAFCEPKVDHVYIGRFGVLPAYRHYGAGSKLLEASESAALVQGFAVTRLNVRVGLDDLRTYYEFHGYEFVGQRSHEGYSGPTYVELEKDLRRGESLFSYGTLQDADVQISTFGRTLAGDADSASGFRLTQLAFDSSPVGYYFNAEKTGSDSDRIVGTRFRIRLDELLRSDDYEADADYERRLVRLDSGVSAWIYSHISR